MNARSACVLPQSDVLQAGQAQGQGVELLTLGPET